jgi:hypothetical protein
MATRIRTIDFLPEIFQTNTNDQFLSATLDQLVQPPDFVKVQGYIGSKFGYGVKSTDQYVVEPTPDKTNYQLEPAVVFIDPVTSKVTDAITYPGIIDALRLESGLEPNHDSLFKNEFYSWDSFVDLDKIINFGQYYWIPEGPESVDVTTETALLTATIKVISNANTYEFEVNGKLLPTKNPTLTLVRGGSYTFEVDEQSKFYIQSLPGMDGVDPNKTNFSTRDISGIEFNGISSGMFTYNVPDSNQQDSYNFPGYIPVDLVTTLSFDKVNGQPLDAIKNIDGVIDIDGKTLLFYGENPNNRVRIGDFFDSNGFDTENTLTPGFDGFENEPVTGTVFKINLVGDINYPIVKLTPYSVIIDDNNIVIGSGVEYIGRNFVKNSDGEIVLIPPNTAILNTLYYQDESNELKFGKIKIIDKPTSQVIDVLDILGQKTYTSPNGIKFSNGLRVKFVGKIFPTEYLNNTYYVEGVGTSIQLIADTELIVPEVYSQSLSAPFDDPASGFDRSGFSDVINLPYTPDYITINRGSLDRNGWSRGNRWFHVDVLTTITANNTLTPIINKALTSNGSNRATRPIIEFYPNLKLIYHGIFGKSPVDYIDTTTTNALTTVTGSDPATYLPDGENSNLFDGCRIVFANDNDPYVVNKIFVATIATVNGSRVITLTKASDGDVNINDQIVIVNGTTNKGYNYYYDVDGWVNSQTKTTVNQAPLFDIFDSNGISLSDGNYYLGTDFNGCTLFQYSVGSGTKDSVLGLPIQYSGVGNLNDINFEATINSTSFNYVNNNVSINQPVNTGYVYQYTDNTHYIRKLGWETAADVSFQYQVFNYVVNNNINSNSIFVLDVPLVDNTMTKWPTSVVYVNNARINTYTTVVVGSTTNVLITSTLTPGDTVTVKAYSDSISNIGYYEIPSNLEQNPFNYQITTINAGDIRGHYKSICNNIPGLTGVSFGANNYRDLGNPVPYGTRIIQNSASVVTPASFVRRQETNFFNSLNYNATEYVKFKSLLINTVNSQDYTPYDTASGMLDDVLDIITSSKTQTTPFFWSDMLPCKTPAIVNTYTFAIGITNTIYPLSKVYSFTIANYNSVLIYVSKIINGITQYVQLMKDVDYFVNTTQPYVLITAQLEDGDIVTVKEYTQTYGNYVPNTPTKMGLYPKFIPEVILDETYLTPTYFIKGHDGSLTKLYDGFDDYGNFIDFRDKVLFEFECRIYNNIKVDAKIPLEYADLFPGQFRSTDYTYDQVMRLYTSSFLNWVGLNRINIAGQYYDSTNEYTWNYKKATNKIDNTVLKQGNWRGVYLWYYDTATPHATPWEMLGLPVKPIWWDDRYGLPPYTSDNLLLWTDLSKGYNYNNGNVVIDKRYSRPNLLDILPVNSKGELLSPFESLVRNYSKATFKTDWVIGDTGPAEYSYLKSSTWPFDLMRMFALAKPAQFFTLGLDLDVYKYNYEFKQYLVFDRLRTTGRQQLSLYGHDDTSPAHSYTTWIIDYLYQYGLPGTTIVENLLTYLDVRLSYRVSGYTDKNKISFYIEKGSPNSTNSSLVVPDDSYHILQYTNEPDDSIVYSSIIIQKTTNGYKVYGNSQTHTYFVVNIPNNSAKQKLITVIDLQVYIDTDYSTDVEYVTYGYEFKNITALANFIIGYGTYLSSQGMVFDDVENSTVLDWNQMVAEVMYWVRTGWEVGSVINLNPCANNFHVEKPTGIIQPFTFYQNNFVLNQNLVPVKLNDLAIYRKDTTFKVKILTNGDTISYLRADTSISEHIVIFDNQTVFNDILYNLITGLRQQRLYIRGNKTSQWNGTLYAPGFIQNQNNVVDWKQNTKYTKGTIVLYKRKYWMANKTVIVPSNVFDFNDWILTSYDKIDTGILANPSTRAKESEYYYDIHRSNIQNDGDLLGFSLIGYRPRSYLSDVDLNDVSQVNLYKNMISEKGTLDIANLFQGATIQNNDLSYVINENWSIKNSEFGGILNHNFVEFTLDENLLTGNPSIVSLINGNNVDIAQQQVPLYNIKNYGRTINNTNVLSTVPDSSITVLPSAGYAHLDDITLYSYTVERISNTVVNSVYKNDYIWIADRQSDWGVFTPITMDNTLKSLTNNLNGSCTLNFTMPHGLSKYDVLAVINSDVTTNVIINGFYVVQQILNNNSISISLTLQANVTTITFNNPALLYKFQSMRVSTPKDINSLPLLNFEYETAKVWVDQSSNNNWAVYQKNINYNDINFEIFDINNGSLGAAVAYMPPLGYYISDPDKGKVYKYIRSGKGDIKTDTITHGPGYGTKMARNSEFMVISEPSNSTSKLYIYRIVALPEVEALVEEQIIPFGSGTPDPSHYIGTSMAFSGDGNYLYVGAPKINSLIYFQRQVDYVFSPVVSTTSTLVNISSVVPNSPASGKMTVKFSGTSFAPISQVYVGATITLSGFSPSLTNTGQRVNGTHVITNVGFKQTGINPITKEPIYSSTDINSVSFTLAGGYTTKTLGVFSYSPQIRTCTLIEQTDPMEKFFVVNGNAITSIPAGKRITFLQFSQLESSILKDFGYEAQNGYTLQQASNATINVAGGVFGTDRRKYYVVISGNIQPDTHFALDPTIDNVDYVATDTNIVYNSGNNTTKVYMNDYFTEDTYNGWLFNVLDNNNHQTSFSAWTGNLITELVGQRYFKILTYANMLPTYITVLTGEYDSTTDTTKIHTVERISYTISVTSLPSISSPSNTFIRAVNNVFNFMGAINMGSFDSYYLGKNPGDLSNSDNTVLQQSNDNFGASIAVNHDGSKVFVGSPTYHVRLSSDENIPPVPDVGVVWMFDRLIETFQVQFTPQQFVDFNVVVFWHIHPTTKVILNGVSLSSKLYAFRYLGDSISEITFNRSLNIKAGDIITVSSPNLVLAQVLTSYEDINGVIPSQKFGTSISCNSTGSEVLIGAPYDHGKEGQDGAVYRFTNEGKRYGYIVGEIPANLVPITNPVTGYTTTSTKIYINGQAVYLDFSQGMNAQQIAQQINDTHIINVFAYATEDDRLVIRLVNNDLGNDNNKLNLTVFNGNYLFMMGIPPYVKTQVIREPHAQHHSEFGANIAFNEYNSFVVTAPKANRYLATFFDRTNNNDHYNTVFDLNLTTFEDVFYNAGAAYMYDYIKPYNESLLNSGQYIYSQPINDSTSVYGSQPLYGSSISFNNNNVVIGSPGYKSGTVGGKINVFENISGVQNWSVYRNSTSVVDFNQIQKAQLYNNLTDENLISLDYIDPLRGKLLGAVRQNLDYIGITDPAGYNNVNVTSNSIIWNVKQIGKTWFNTTTTKFLNYHQDDLAYNAQYWGQIFPGSIVTVFTWIESDVTPVNYKGTGTPYDLQKYTTAYAVNSNNGLAPKYYYWVRNTNTLYGDKTLSDSVLERYITSPQNSGIAYMAPLRSDTYALYNARDYINGVNTNMHLGFSVGVNEASIQNEFKLIQNNSSSDFLPGLPNYALGHTAPAGLYNRLLESFAGIDETGASVPNYTLPKYLQTGISVRPRQSMFINRFNALKNYLEYANSVLSQYPINEFSNLTYLAATGAYFDVSAYWSNIYWWATGYNNKTKTKIEVGVYSDLVKLTATEGLIVGVAKNGQGKREVYLYTNSIWTRIGLQDGTIQFSDMLWDYQTNKIGFGDNFFDTENFDSFPAIETYYIIRALNEQIYTGPLLEYRNKSLILMFEYIQSENNDANNYLPWLNKSSFADVTYTIRDLKQDVNYHVDNTTMLSSYINEVKPYHTVIKDFDLRYTSTDIAYANTSDFDVAPLYNSKTGKFTSPQLTFIKPNIAKNEYGIGDSVWSNNSYTNWYNHYGLALNGIPNFEIGILRLYMTATTNTLLIDNARGMPDAGILYIENEIIGYNSVNRETGLVSGLTRGIGNSLVSEHYPGIIITTDLPGVVVLDTGRDYIDAPKVTAYIDTTIYPAPTREAILQPVMSGGKVIAVDILDPGENYPITPEIVFSSSYDITFTQTSLNFVDNTIIIPGVILKTGDLIKSKCINGNGSIIDGFYYVYVIAQLEGQELISITLHKTLSASLIGHNKIKLNSGSLSTTLTGTDYTFSLTARAIAITTNLSVRGILNTLRFDRTSYIPKVVPWEPNKFWGSRYYQGGVDNINSASSDVSLYYGRPYTGLTGTVTNPSSSAGTGAIFTVTNVLLGGTYNATITNGGTNYGVFDTIKILGTHLSGITPTNDCYIQVSTVSSYYHDLLQDTTTGNGTNARFNITVNAYSEALTGTLTVTNGSSTVTGTGTLFYTEVNTGSIIYINGVQCVVNTVPITDPTAQGFNTRLTLTTPYTGTSGTYSAKVAVSSYHVDIDNVFYPGQNYLVGDTIKIVGTRLNGSSPTNDLTIDVVAVSNDGSGKITSASAVTGLGYGTSVAIGTIKTFTVSGIALDSNFASLQGAVMPVQSINNDHGVTQDNSGNVIVRLDYYPSSLQPGQIQGSKTYFYHNTSPYTYTDVDGTSIEIHRPRFNPYDISLTYYIKIINGGTQHYVGENIIIPGSVFSSPSEAGKNDVTIKVTQINNPVSDITHGFIGGILTASVTGISARVFDVYYVQPITMTQVKVFYDPGMLIPVKYSDFPYVHNVDLVDNTIETPGTLLDYNLDTTNISDFAYIPEPFTLGLSYKYDFNSVVSYDGRVWKCIESNNDTVFNMNNWIELNSDDRSLNALDRIVAYYEPAINMPAKDLQQLVRGISYPGSVYYGNSFSPEDIIPIDIVLKGEELYPRSLDIKVAITTKLLLTGSLTLTNGSHDVVGIGTLFALELAYNSRIYINDVEYVVSNVTDNYNITLANVYSGINAIYSAYKFQYVAIGESDKHSILLTSLDGLDWDNHILAENSLNVTDIIYAGGKYLVSTASPTNPMLISHDGITWLGQGQATLFDKIGYDNDDFDSSPESYPADSVNRVILGSDGYYYGVGTFITRSVDGIIWEKKFDFGTKTINTIYNIHEVHTGAFDGFIAVGAGNSVISGKDTAAPVVSKTSIIITSIDGMSWSFQNPFLTTSPLYTIASNNNIIVTTGGNGKLWYSVNGHNWSLGTVAGSPVTHDLNASTYVNGKFIVVGNHGTILTSTDGINWTQRTNNTLTVDNLNDVMYDGIHYYIVGDNATIIRSTDTINWINVSMLTPAVPESTVAGNDFLYGYGPDELIPGIITESLSLKVITSPGASWDNTPLIPQTTYFQNTSFGMKSITSTTNSVSFDTLLKTPAKVNVFIIDSTTKLGNRIYSGYTVNWINKTVTLTNSLPAGKLLMVEVYEVGNGKQTARGSTTYTPLRTNSITGNSEIYIKQPFAPLLNTPVLYCNGVELLYQTDYNVTYATDPNLSKITFNTVYNQNTDYITWAILDTSISDFRTSELSYSIPETQIFTGNTRKNIILTSNLGGSNIDNAIVEKNGLRLIPTVDYSIDFATSVLTLVSNRLSSDTIAVTTFNETDRLFLETMVYTATASQTVFALTQFVTDVTKNPIYYTDVYKAWVTINGKRIDPSKLHYDNLNNLIITATINASDIVIVTVTTDGGTPNSTQFNIDVDKYGNSNVYRTNDGDGTWLTKDFNLGDTIMYLYNVNPIMDKITETATVASVNSMIVAYVECDVSQVRQLVVYDQTTTTIVTNYVLEVVNGRSALVFADTSQVNISDTLIVTINAGNTIELNGEKIRYTQVDFVNNTISGLTRGILGTGPVLSSMKYSEVYGLTKNRTLDPKYYRVEWNTSNYSSNFGDPLQISNSPAATFLKYGHY